MVKTKEEAINILRIMFPGKNQYMYETVAKMLLEDSPKGFTRHYKYSCDLPQTASQSQFTIPAIAATDRVPFKWFGPEFADVYPDQNPAAFKKPITARGLRSSVVIYDENLPLSEDNTYVQGIMDICYELYCKYITTHDRAFKVLDGESILLDKGKIERLRSALDRLEPLVNEYCPFCLWYSMLRQLILNYDKEKENV